MAVTHIKICLLRAIGLQVGKNSYGTAMTSTNASCYREVNTMAVRKSRKNRYKKQKLYLAPDINRNIGGYSYNQETVFEYARLQTLETGIPCVVSVVESL